MIKYDTRLSEEKDYPKGVSYSLNKNGNWTEAKQVSYEDLPRQEIINFLLEGRV